MLSRSAVCILSSRLLPELSCSVMLNARCQLRTFTFYLSMTGNPVLSVGDIAKETGLSRQRIWQLAVTGGLPAERANPGGKHHRFHDSTAFAAWRKEKARQSARPRGLSPVQRSHRISRRRQEKIEKLWEILKNQTEVSASEKEAALSYYGCLAELTDAMSVLYMLWWVRSWKMRQPRIPLLEGIHALFESKLRFDNADPKMDALIALESAIKRLPTRSETTPQTEQSSLNVSA